MKLKEGSKINVVNITNPDKTISVGDVVLEDPEPSQKVILDINYLSSVLDALKIIGVEEVALRVQNDFPVLITDGYNNGTKTNGFLIAPRV